ncbi:hypothetical protein 7S15_27 [uncultured Caudovirales phage]|uniref:Phage protein n=1 Tax=uncultured Caudovirales phage TaxID=2100421 RepID=A0A2H4JFD7_9CAUD|nr:hypothetical protein 7S15_27 [uncultured Caudovirales phage]
MVKIKQKKQLNLPQLIEWAWDNDIKNEIFIADKQLTNIEFDDTGDVLIYGNDNKKTVKFSIEVEEEITEDTPLSMIIECDEDSSFWVFKEITLKEMHESKCLKETTKYYKDEDEKMYLIWRDGKLVE